MVEMEANRRAAIRWFEEVWTQGKLELIPELALEDAVGHDMEGPGVTTKGIEAFRDFHRTMRSAIPDLSLEVLDTIAEGDRVVIRIRSAGTHSGDALGVPPTGSRIDFGAIVIFRFENGKIAEAWNFIDQLAFYQQLRILSVR